MSASGHFFMSADSPGLLHFWVGSHRTAHRLHRGVNLVQVEPD